MDNEEFDFSLSTGDKLFIDSLYPRASLTFVFQGFGELADCYQRGAITLIDVSLKDKSEMDYNIYPILFLIRHYVELRLKELTQGLNFIQKQSSDFPQGHKLQPLWGNLRQQYSEVIGWDISETTLDAIENIINEISGLDPNSMTFRYPVDTIGNKFKKPHYISLRNLKSVFVSLTELLDIMAMQVAYNVDVTEDMVSDVYRHYK